MLYSIALETNDTRTSEKTMASDQYTVGYNDGMMGRDNQETSQAYNNGYADGRAEREWQLENQASGAIEFRN